MNFEFLKKIQQFEKLYTSCCEAEKYVRKDPNVSASAARRSIEYIVKLIYSSSVTPYIEGLSVYDMLTDPQFMRHMDDSELINEIHAIRRAGNRAVHEGTVDQNEAEQVLQKLHHVIGEVCIFLGLVDSYPPFVDPERIQTNEDTYPQSEIELEISNDLVRLLHTHIAAHPSVSQTRSAINVHIPVKERKNSETRIDPAANSKSALYASEEFLKEMLPTVRTEVNRHKCIITLKAKDGKTVAASVKSGCPQIGSVVDGEIVILPGIDFILYAPDFSTEEPLIAQLRVFTKEDFLEMWQSLGLVRAKVSSARVKELQKQYGNDYTSHFDQHADVVAVQSFSNSGRKKPLVWKAFKERPLLTKEGIGMIAKALEENSR